MCEEGQCCREMSTSTETLEEQVFRAAVYCSRCGEKLLPETKLNSTALKYDRVYGFPYYYWIKKCPNHKPAENIAHDFHYQQRADKSKGPF